MINYPLKDALNRFYDPSIPSFAPAEEEIDEPTWKVSDRESDSALPGRGLLQHPMLYIGEGCNRMYLIQDGKVQWTFDAGKGWEYDDIWMLTNGNILFSHMYWAGEITPQKKYVWKFEVPKGCELHTLQPIGLDKVMYVLNAEPLPKVIIYNIKNREIEYEHEIPYEAGTWVHGQFRRFRYTAEGTFLASCLSMDKVIEYNADFQEIWSYEIAKPWAAIRLKNGNTLINGEAEGVVREVNRLGETVWEVYVKDLFPAFTGLTSQTCVRLENGNTILCIYGGNGEAPQLIEVTPEKQVVWILQDWKNLGPATAIQILDESGIPEVPGDCQR